MAFGHSVHKEKVMTRTLLTFFGCLVLTLAFAGTARADCCSTVCNNKCGDCTAGTPCCGHGPCNIFCCNCDGGCRHGACDGASVRKNFDAIDTDHSGSISWDELKAWAKKNHKKGTAADWKKGFDQADANH